MLPETCHQEGFAKPCNWGVWIVAGLCEKNEYARSIGFLKCTEHDPQPLEQQSIKASHQESTSFARVIVCCEAGYDPDNDPYDVTTAVIEVSPKEPPVSWLYQLRIRCRFFRGQQMQVLWNILDTKEGSVYQRKITSVLPSHGVLKLPQRGKEKVKEKEPRGNKRKDIVEKERAHFSSHTT